LSSPVAVLIIKTAGRPHGPIDAQRMLNRGTAFAVHCLEESGVGFILIIIIRDKPPDFLLARRVKKDKDMECVVGIPEKAGTQ
jgi:hypothetical protein